jgi:hypothetical protein
VFDQLKRGWLGWMGLASLLLAGAVLRLVWVEDMEYKYDEEYMFERTQEVGRTEPWPWLGMTSGAGLRNPGMSVWVFLALGKVFAVREPTDLARAVQVLNVVALLFVVVFAVRAVPAEEREAWLWAAALAAVNPLAVLFQRKIWAQSVLPVFSLAMLVGWWYRDRRWGAFLWGLVGACLGQIHMSGFFFAAGFLAWAALFDRKRVAWLGWLAGSFLGALPLVPWLHYVATHLGDRTAESEPWTNFLKFAFWKIWATDALGLGSEYTLNPKLREFLDYPFLGGRPTHLMLVLHLGVVLIGAVILIRSAYFLWEERLRWRELWVGNWSPTAFAQSAALWGFGLLLMALNIGLYRHYLIATFPLEFVWLARQALVSPGGAWQSRFGRGLLATLCFVHLVISAGFVAYIHVHRDTLGGDYGTP